MYARDVMTSPVVTAGPDSTLSEIVELMLDNRISGVPIVDAEGKLVGIVSEGDLMRRTEIGTERHRSWWLSAFSGKVSLAEEFVKSHGIKASEIMTRQCHTARPDTPLWEIAETMEKQKIKRVPVLRGDKLVGIVSRANVLQALTAQRHRLLAESSKDDLAIREELLRTLQHERWPNIAHLNVVVREGTVYFWGLVSSDAQREALKVAAENVSGVKAIVDHTIIAGS